MTAIPNEHQAEDLNSDLGTLMRALSLSLSPYLDQLARVLEAGRPVVVLPSDYWVPRTMQVAQGSPVQLFGDDLGRLRVTVANKGVSDLWLFPSSAAPPLTGTTATLYPEGAFVLSGGDSVTIDTKGGIAVMAPSAAGIVSAFTEGRS